MKRQKWPLRSNLLNQILFAFGLMTFSRLVWFVANVFWLPPIGIMEYVKAHLIGIYFDIPVVAMIYAPVWIWLVFGATQRIKRPRVNKLLFIFSTLIAFIFNGIDTGYSQVTAKRSGYELFEILGDDANRLTPYIIDNWYLILILGALGYLIFQWVPTKGEYPQLDFKAKPLRGLATTAAFGGLWLLSFRGGWQLRPLRAIDASNFVQPEIAPLITSTPLQIISTWQRNHLPAFNFPLKNNRSSPFGNAKPLPNFPLSKTLNGGWVQPNIVVIVVESLARDYTGFGNSKPVNNKNLPFTPFLDQLVKNPQTIYFPFCFANGTKSIEMVPSIFCGIPSLMSEFYVTSSYSSNKVTNAFLLANQANPSFGYTTAFFHGSNNGTMGFQSFLKQTGLQQYHGISQYPEPLYKRDFDGNWGIFDEPYLQHFIQCLDTINNPNKPFFASVFTLSSHHPYTIPEKYLNKLPGDPGTVQHTIAYADIALKGFFKTAATKPWFKNTIFIITGDHTSHSDQEYFYSQSGHYEVPLLIYSPDIDLKYNLTSLTKISDSLILNATNKTISQCDILPTLWSLLGATNPRLGFGRSAFDTDYVGYSTHLDKDLYYIVQYPYVLALNEKGQAVDFHKQLRNDRKATPINMTGDQFNWMRNTLMIQMNEYSRRIRQNQWE